MALTIENLHMNVDFSPYEHIALTGYPEMVLARGKVIVKDNRFLREPDTGRFLRRKTVARYRVSRQ